MCYIKIWFFGSTGTDRHIVGTFWHQPGMVDHQQLYELYELHWCPQKGRKRSFVINQNDTIPAPPGNRRPPVATMKYPNINN
jgi:hypothetical protein